MPADIVERLPKLPPLGCDMDGAPNRGYTESEMRAYAAKAVRAALAERAPGWKLVPVEPTEAMIAAGTGAQAAASTHVLERLTRIGWHAMLAAAPTKEST